MITSYKFWYILRDDNGFIKEATIRIWEGDKKDVEITKFDGSKETVNMYVRERQLDKKELTHLNAKTKKEYTGKDTVLFTDKDFGKIKTNEELVSFLNKQLAKDPVRTPIEAQK